MPNSLVAILALVAMMLLGGGLIGQMDRARFLPRWLLIAAGLVFLNEAAITSLFGLLPNVIGGEWNWQGKLLALASTLAIISLPAFGSKNTGFTLAQYPGNLRSVIPVVGLYILLFLALALAFPSDPSTGEDIAFQLTMPGIEEEAFYRGTLLFALNEAFRGRARLLGVDWGWGALLSCVVFGFAHAFGYADGGFSFDPVTMALTAIPALIAVWLREKTGSILLPVLLHNFGNSISMLV